MAKQTILLCDFGNGSCKNEAQTYRVWREGDRQARAIDLCDEHASPLLNVFAEGKLVDLPSKPRVRMDVTKLKVTPKTAPLKKE